MPTVSTYTLVKRIDAEISRTLAGAQAIGLVEGVASRDIKLLKRDMADARLDVRDYELADTRDEQRKLAGEAKARLKTVEQGILAASQYNIFSAVEVAQLSAIIAQLQERLE